MTSDGASSRRDFVTAQVEALAPLDFVVVGVSTPPFDAVQVLRETDGSLAVVVSLRDPSTPYTDEQRAALTTLGFPADDATASGTAGLRVATPPVDAAAASALADDVLTKVFGVDLATPVDVRHGSERDVREATEQLAAMRTRIEPVLTAMLGKTVPQDEDGDYLVDLGHSRVFVAPRVLPGRPPPIIRVFAITNAGMTLTPELGLFLSRLNFTLMFGRFSIDSDNAAIWFDETLLGEHVTDEELRFTVEMVATTANEWDQKIAATFGGRTRTPEVSPGGAESPSELPASKPGQGGYL